MAPGHLPAHGRAHTPQPMKRPSETQKKNSCCRCVACSVAPSPLQTESIVSPSHTLLLAPGTGTQTRAVHDARLTATHQFGCPSHCVWSRAGQGHGARHQVSWNHQERRPQNLCACACRAAIAGAAAPSHPGNQKRDRAPRNALQSSGLKHRAECC